MDFKSHIMLSLATCKLYSFSFLNGLAFRFGSVEPDINVSTYLKGTFSGRKFSGHMYPNIIPRMEKLQRKLVEAERYGILYHYRLGKLIHYISDAFTFPHNVTFPGSLGEHMLYEDDLEIALLKRLGEKNLRHYPLIYTNALSFVKRLHDEYLTFEGNVEKDTDYIIRCTLSVTYAFLAKSLMPVTLEIAR